MPRERRSFFERLTGSVSVNNREELPLPGKKLPIQGSRQMPAENENGDWIEEEEGQLTVDTFQTPDEIVVQAFVAGVRPDDIDVSITHEMLTLRGKRERMHEVSGDNYFYQELYWGSFSRSILLPAEVDVDDAQATIKNGLLTIRLKKQDKNRVQKLSVKNG